MTDAPQISAWQKEFPGAITVSNTEGIILAMNARAAEVFADDGGLKLIGTNALDCHPEPSRSKFAGMLKEQKINVYTIEKNGKKKLIYQAPWYDNGRYAGFIELSLDIPFDMPHFVRGQGGKQ